MIESEVKFSLWDYRDARDRNDIADWTRRQEKRQRAQLNLKLDMLQQYGDDVGRSVLMRVSSTIYKLKAKTKTVQLRLMLCRGPLPGEDGFSLLIGATEVGWKLQPADAVERGEERRLEIIEKPNERRVEHERIN